MVKPEENGANGSMHDGLTAEQALQIGTMIDGKVEKSENRVLAAIEGLKADMSEFRTEIKAEMAELRSETSAEFGRVNGRLDTLTKDVSDVKAGLASVKPHLIVVYGLLVSGIGLLTWMLSVLFEPVR